MKCNFFHFTSGYLNDLWKFSPSTNQWTWISGNNTINVPGVYGIQGQPTLPSTIETSQTNTMVSSTSQSQATGLSKSMFFLISQTTD